MTYEKAADAIKTWIGPMRKIHQGDDFANEFIDCAEFMTKSVVREAVEKTDSKKPLYIKEHDDIYFDWQCPNCKREFIKSTQCVKYCVDCGQALDWE